MIKADTHIPETRIFTELSEGEIYGVLNCLEAEKKKYQKDEIIYQMGDKVTRMGLIISGSANISRLDVWGGQNILEHIEAGEVFAEVYACIPNEPLMVEVAAAEDVELLFLDAGRMMQTCGRVCRYHSQLLRNLLEVMAEKNLNLTRKMNYLTQKSIRERLLSYLSFQAMRQGTYQFEIPFNRQQLADYLSVDRSALSGELSKMKKDGLITYKKNHFVLHVHDK